MVYTLIFAKMNRFSRWTTRGRGLGSSILRPMRAGRAESDLTKKPRHMP